MSWVGGDHLPFLSLEMPLCILELKKKKKPWSLDSWLCWFVTRRLPLVGLHPVLPECPELHCFHPFLSLLYCRNPESSTGEEQWMPGGCKGMSERLEAAVSTGRLGWRAGIKKESREKLQNSSGEVWVTHRTPGGGCPTPVFASPGKGTGGNALFGQNKCSNGMSSEGSRKQSRVKQNTKKITPTVQIIKYPKYCIQEKLRQLNLYWKYKNTKFCYIKKTS